jgi:hypothetical protein
LCSQATGLLVPVADMEIVCCGRRRSLEAMHALLLGVVFSL